MQSSLHSAQTPAHGWHHDHVFSQGNPLAERGARWAIGLTVSTMAVEIAGGWWFNSMALLADGWHMSSHALALGLSALAYAAARRLQRDQRFAFGTWKIEILGGYSSAILLLGIALLMAFQSVARLMEPSPIAYDQAIALAAFGLLVNLACAWLLRHGHGHGHGHGHSHDHDHGHPHEHHGARHADLNLRSAYLHVVADAATSVLAIVALCGGKLWNAAWLDPLMGIAGSVLVGIWALGLMRDTARVLLDAEMDAPVAQEIREAVASSPVPASLCDLHVWRVGADRYACIVSLATTGEMEPDDLKRRLRVHEELAHISVEVNRVRPAPAAA
ncbi:CDF family Co(II)/Ni(II) efflux transporter DmeF [Paracidovorax anthurii]|uniref:Cation diffusion facilitator family transporter n=1 Tax=Paracidovorax anthurii TaxID=78229 RepID=A0A328ZH19_9BURK|nr:CDF family Co(II)/Ni(II) efflux transporter DmeF [Paracidovorax anthurii]RAR85159.1 cation diffusion facilitator family transporter [Paracidovorax anthurii]